jgi:alpha-tubulin suppressor-like RCC1 family protein
VILGDERMIHVTLARGPTGAPCRASDSPQRFYVFNLPPHHRALIAVSPTLEPWRAVVRVTDRCDADACLADGASFTPGAPVRLTVDNPGDAPVTRVVSVSAARAGEGGAYEIYLRFEPLDEPAVAEIAVGHDHTCARRTDGSVLCWGDNRFGQLSGGDEMRRVPALVEGLAGRATQLALGDGFTCARMDDGTVHCWGRGEMGQLGAEARESCAGDMACARAAQRVPGLGGVVQVAAGAAHACALETDGQVVCWGLNGSGQVGDGTLGGHAPPTRVQALSGVVRIALGGAHGCARLADDTAWCGGANQHGQLGDGTTTDRPLAERVLGLSGVSGLALGRGHSCAWLADGTARCWGDGEAEQLGSVPLEACAGGGLHALPRAGRRALRCGADDDREPSHLRPHPRRQPVVLGHQRRWPTRPRQHHRPPAPRAGEHRPRARTRDWRGQRAPVRAQGRRQRVVLGQQRPRAVGRWDHGGPEHAGGDASVVPAGRKGFGVWGLGVGGRKR